MSMGQVDAVCPEAGRAHPHPSHLRLRLEPIRVEKVREFEWAVEEGLAWWLYGDPMPI